MKCTNAFKLIRHKEWVMKKDKLQQTQHSLHKNQIRDLYERVNNVKWCNTNATMIRNAEGDNLWKTRST
jgi:CRISPR/Cas system CSM-associated protein Csm2 small subunit